MSNLQVCDKCFIRFRSEESLKKHMTDVHSTKSEEEVTKYKLKQNMRTKELLVSIKLFMYLYGTYENLYC